MSITVRCEYCNKEIKRLPSQVSARNFCCHAHRNHVLVAGPGNARWRGGVYIQAGYRMVKTPEGYVQEHRLVMEKKLGRPLKPEERVHHLDNDKLNNAPENLELMENQSAHVRAHDLRANPTRGLPVWDWDRRGGACADCGETTRPHYAHGVCGRCYTRRRIAKKRHVYD